MKKYILETNRCRLRLFNQEDAESVFHLNLHPDIFRFTTDPPFESVEHARKFIEDYEKKRINGFGRWAVELKSDGAFIGWCGIKYIPEENEYDVGYRFLPEYLGQGYAVETGVACIEYGFSKGINRIVARVHKENFRSVRVSAKLNMLYEKDLMYDGVPWMNFVVEQSPEKPNQSDKNDNHF